MIPLPDVRCVQRSQRDVATCLALVVEKGVQEARAEPELLEVRVDGEKCDMGVFKLVTTQITEEKADEVAFLSIDAETCTTNPLLPGVLEITDRRAVKALGENFTSGLEVGHLQRCQFEAHVAETHLVVMVGTGRAPSILLAYTLILKVSVLVIPNFGADTQDTVFAARFGVQVPVVFGIIRSEMVNPI